MTLEAIDKLDPKHTAVVVVDMQNDFCHPDGVCAGVSGAAGLHNGDAVERELPQLIEAARSRGVFIAFVRMINDVVYLSPPVAERLERIGLLGIGLQTGTWGADYYRDIRPQPGNPREVEIIKHRYSAFHGTDLDLTLKANGIRTCAFTGVATSGCVESTAREGLFHDYFGVMVSDCVADGDKDTHDASLRKYGRSFGEVMTAAELVAAWDRALVTS